MGKSRAGSDCIGTDIVEWEEEEGAGLFQRKSRALGKRDLVDLNLSGL